MKATCERDKLLHAFQMAASVAPARSPKPILQNVKLDVTKDGAILMGTDLEVGIRVDVPGFTVDAPGSVVLPRDRFGKILTESSDEKLGPGERRPEGAGPRPAERIPTSFGEPGRISRRDGLRGEEVSRDAGPLLPRGGAADGLRHRQREQPVCLGGRAAGADGPRG